MSNFDIGDFVRLHGIQSKPQLNYRIGTIVSDINISTGRYGVSVLGELIAIKQSNIASLHESERAQYADLRSVAPASLDIFIASLKGSSSTVTHHHLLAEQLDVWAADADVEAFLSDTREAEAQQESLVKSFAFAIQSLGIAAESQLTGSYIRVFPCIGCNMPYDTRASHDHGARKVCLGGRNGPYDPLSAVQVIEAHRALLLLALIVSLLSWPCLPHSSIAVGKDRLLDLLVVEAPAGVSPSDWLMQSAARGESWLLLLPLALGLLDNTSGKLPKAAHLAVAFMSQCVSRRPAAALFVLDSQPTVQALHHFLGGVFDIVTQNSCMVEVRFGVAQLLDAIPLLYHMGDWKDAKTALSSRKGSILVGAVGSFAMNVLHLLSCGEEDPCDCPPGDDLLTNCAEVLGARVSVEGSFARGPGWQLMHTRPLTFAFACLLETVGRWQRRGIMVSSALIPCTPKRDALCRETMMEPLSDCFAEYLPRFDLAAARCPQLEYLRPIYTAIIEGTKPPLPPEDVSLLRGSLHSHMKCSLRGCFRTTTPEDTPLKLCNGKCGGLARYCSVDHQRTHWAQHKMFCQHKS